MTDNPFDPAYVAPAPVDDQPAPVTPSKPGSGRVVYHRDLEQGTAAWMKARLGLLTASEMKLILTPATLKFASNDKARVHLYEILAQRVTGHVEETFESWDILRGREDEIEARLQYHRTYAPVEECGFITNDKWGFKLGYSPDGLVGDDGLIECKSRKQKLQMQTIIEATAKDTIPEEFMLQCQTALLVSERKWLDFISYSGGLPMTTTRVYPDAKFEAAIISAARDFEAKLADARVIYDALIQSGARLIPTERTSQEMHV